VEHLGLVVLLHLLVRLLILREIGLHLRLVLVMGLVEVVEAQQAPEMREIRT
jgi:hypothetical protein